MTTREKIYIGTAWSAVFAVAGFTLWLAGIL